MNIDETIGWPSIEGNMFTIIPVNILHEFNNLLNEILVDEIEEDSPIFKSNLSKPIDSIVCLASMNACKTDSQIYLLESEEQINSWFVNRIEQYGHAKLIECSLNNHILSIKFKSFSPWPIIAGIILEGWQRNNGILGQISINSIDNDIIDLTVKSRRNIENL